MNTLTLKITEHNGLSFDLLIDGEPVEEILNDGNNGIPYWIIGEGLPTFPPSGRNAAPNIRIVSVCNCGEYGCGHSRCEIKEHENSVEFFNFAGDVGSEGSSMRFEFPKVEYEKVCEKISELARAKNSKNG